MSGEGSQKDQISLTVAKAWLNGASRPVSLTARQAWDAVDLARDAQDGCDACRDQSCEACARLDTLVTALLSY